MFTVHLINSIKSILYMYLKAIDTIFNKLDATCCVRGWVEKVGCDIIKKLIPHLPYEMTP